MSALVLFFSDKRKKLLFMSLTRLPASRSSSVGPEGRFSFFHPKVKVKKTISLTSFVFWGLVGLKVLIKGDGNDGEPDTRRKLEFEKKAKIGWN